LLATLALIAPARAADDFKLEPGFTPLFNGKDLTGWKEKRGGASLDGKTQAYKGRFKVVGGELVIDPTVRGDVIIDTARPLAGDLHIKFEFLPGPGCNNDLFLRGLKFDLVKSQVKGFKEGEWNLLEIIVKGDKAEVKCNGLTQRTIKLRAASSPFGVRAEFGPVRIRNMRVKEGG
jgi:hypothetical protein